MAEVVTYSFQKGSYERQFKYFPLTWKSHSRTSNNKINVLRWSRMIKFHHLKNLLRNIIPSPFIVLIFRNLSWKLLYLVII